MLSKMIYVTTFDFIRLSLHYSLFREKCFHTNFVQND